MRTITVVWWWTSWILVVYYLLKNFNHLKVNWIFPSDNSSIWVWEATIPQVCDFLDELWLDINTILKYLNWSIKLWIKFDWFNKYRTFYHSFGNSKTNCIRNMFLMKFNLIDESLLKDTSNYAVHFDVKLLIDYLYSKLENFDNLNIYRDEVNNVKLRRDFSIESVNNIKSDLYIDCTWFSRVLISKIRTNNFIYYPIINNSAYVYRWHYNNFNYKKYFNCYTNVLWKNYWWIWHIPLWDKISLWYIHNNKGSEKVKKEFVEYIENIFWSYNINNLSYIKFKTWRNKYHFLNNVFCIWLSSAFIEPMESTWLYFITENIKLLWNYLNWQITKEYINNKINEDYDNVFNFIIWHYKYSNNTSDYWLYYKSLDLNISKSWLFGYYSWYCILDWLEQVNLVKKLPDYKKYYFLKRYFSSKDSYFNKLPNYMDFYKKIIQNDIN